MALKYDFDIFPDAPGEDRQENRSAGSPVAYFRDADLVAALEAADDQIKDLFAAAGFGLDVYRSGAPDGRYPEEDEMLRISCLQKLADEIAASEGLNDADWGGFSVDEFMDHLSVARPIDLASTETQVPAHQGPKKKSYARMGLVAGGAIVAASTVSLALGAFGS